MQAIVASTSAPSGASSSHSGSPSAALRLAELPARLHHYAFVVRDQEVNRQFFEDIIGLPLIATWCESGARPEVQGEMAYCHTFYGLADGGALAFFQFDSDAMRRADAHAELKRWLAGDHRTNNDDRPDRDAAAL